MHFVWKNKNNHTHEDEGNTSQPIKKKEAERNTEKGIRGKGREDSKREERTIIYTCIYITQDMEESMMS